MKLQRTLVLGPALLAALFLVGCRGLTVAPDLRLSGPASLSGRVTAAGTGTPVAGAVVAFEGAGALQEARTDQYGRYTLRVVWERGEEASPGLAPLRARVEAPGYRGVALRLALAPGLVRRDFALVRGS